jgi:hypothetical protein
VDLEEIEWEDTNWNHWVPDRDLGRVLVNNKVKLKLSP